MERKKYGRKAGTHMILTEEEQADETGVSNCELVECGFSPKGRPPILPVETKRQRVNMISAISSQGKVRFMVLN